MHAGGDGNVCQHDRHRSSCVYVHVRVYVCTSLRTRFYEWKVIPANIVQIYRVEIIASYAVHIHGECVAHLSLSAVTKIKGSQLDTRFGNRWLACDDALGLAAAIMWPLSYVHVS